MGLVLPWMLLVGLREQVHDAANHLPMLQVPKRLESHSIKNFLRHCLLALFTLLKMITGWIRLRK